MRKLNNIQTAIFLLGGILMAVGAGTTLLGWGSAPYIYALGALGFASMQMYQRYEYGERDIRKMPMDLGLKMCYLLELNPFELVLGEEVGK